MAGRQPSEGKGNRNDQRRTIGRGAAGVRTSCGRGTGWPLECHWSLTKANPSWTHPPTHVRHAVVYRINGLHSGPLSDLSPWLVASGDPNHASLIPARPDSPAERQPGHRKAAVDSERQLASPGSTRRTFWRGLRLPVAASIASCLELSWIPGCMRARVGRRRVRR